MPSQTAWILLAGLALGAVVAGMAGRRSEPGRPAAAAIMAGAERANAEDEALQAGGEDAGYRWAERNGIDQVDACNGFTRAFRQGCEAWVSEAPAIATKDDGAASGHR
jgi:hypothetical protein